VAGQCRSAARPLSNATEVCYKLARVTRLQGRRVALEQLALELASAPPRWRFSRLVLRSPHRERIRARLEFVRGFFPEIEGVTVRVGLARKRGVLGWGSLDPDDPGVWVRPKRLDSFTVAHEFTHLLQAMKLVPRGERACDLWALARSPLLVDTAPGYLEIPAPLRRHRTVPPAWSVLLHRAACEALAARSQGERGYLRAFEQWIAEAWRRARSAGP
jgi:hypothetical protein